METGVIIFQYITFALEIASSAVIVAAVIISAVMTAARWKKEKNKKNLYRYTRVMIGRGLLLSLELLIAADIVRTVGVEFTLRNIGLLGLVVVIRIILGFSLEVELTGKWPWHGGVEQ